MSQTITNEQNIQQKTHNHSNSKLVQLITKK